MSQTPHSLRICETPTPPEVTNCFVNYGVPDKKCTHPGASILVWHKTLLWHGFQNISFQATADGLFTAKNRTIDDFFRIEGNDSAGNICECSGLLRFPGMLSGKKVEAVGTSQPQMAVISKKISKQATTGASVFDPLVQTWGIIGLLFVIWVLSKIEESLGHHRTGIATSIQEINFNTITRKYTPVTLLSDIWSAIFTGVYANLLTLAFAKPPVSKFAVFNNFHQFKKCLEKSKCLLYLPRWLLRVSIINQFLNGSPSLKNSVVLLNIRMNSSFLLDMITDDPNRAEGVTGVAFDMTYNVRYYLTQVSVEDLAVLRLPDQYTIPAALYFCSKRLGFQKIETIKKAMSYGTTNSFHKRLIGNYHDEEVANRRQKRSTCISGRKARCTKGQTLSSAENQTFPKIYFIQLKDLFRVVAINGAVGFFLIALELVGRYFSLKKSDSQSCHGCNYISCENFSAQVEAHSNCCLEHNSQLDMSFLY